ncbi:DNA polymerase/3'-5' exonuclease PolX [Bacillus kwashiorkori]|uniref:DNA polymerase/3'-5' exonuclease PolX n=1 Tax=Bacillus kwashiorkori TaxID=1522318 RepID=UPI000785D3BA|nr:DNA polymerase/3'-5' exonuclease PolX [Bacillus kwashiorkori]
MATTKKEIIRLLESIAIYMELKGDNPFKLSAFRKAANALEFDERDIAEVEDFTTIPGIGKGTAAVIMEYIETGSSSVLEELKKEVPKGLIPLLQIPGLGGKTIARLYKELQIENIADLKTACEVGKVRILKGFGEKKEEKILAAIESLSNKQDRLPLAMMIPIVEWIEDKLTNIPEINEFSRAGSIRRVKEMVKDLDFVIATENPEIVREQLLQLPNIKEKTNQGDTKVSIVFSFDHDVSVDFRLVQLNEFATTLHHFTGSKEHNVRMRQIAKERHEKISEYGVENLETGSVQTFSSEKEFYRHFQLPYISPELREDGTEIDKLDLLDSLVENIHGDLHMHTTWSDGNHSLEEMIEACLRLGYEYMAITDHSQYLKVANGLTRDRLLKQKEEIARLNEKYRDIQILSGIEMDILPDGSLDFEDELLKEMDFVIASIHSAFSQSEELIMKRLANACKNPYVHMIGHPTGRVIGRRSGYPVNMDALIKIAKETNTILELNASPKRLDLHLEHLQKTEKAGLPIIINTDAHHTDTLTNMELGVKYARKAWIQKNTVLNTLPKHEFLQVLNKKRESFQNR